MKFRIQETKFNDGSTDWAVILLTPDGEDGFTAYVAKTENAAKSFIRRTESLVRNGFPVVPAGSVNTELALEAQGFTLVKRVHTKEEAQRYAEKRIPKDLKRINFKTFVTFWPKGEERDHAYFGYAYGR